MNPNSACACMLVDEFVGLMRFNGGTFRWHGGYMLDGEVSGERGFGESLSLGAEGVGEVVVN